MEDKTVDYLIQESQNRALKKPNWAPQGPLNKIAAPIASHSPLVPHPPTTNPGLPQDQSKHSTEKHQTDPAVRLHLPAIPTARPSKWKTSNTIKEPETLKFTPAPTNRSTLDLIRKMPRDIALPSDKATFMTSRTPVPVRDNLHPPGRTGDVFTSLLARLNTVETQLRATKIQVQLKEAEIETLQTELQFQKELAAKKGDEDRVKAVERQCEEYKAQIAEMQVFLKGQGMIWKQGAPPMISENEFPFNFTHLLDSINALNIHHGEGQSITVNINGKGRLMTPPNVHLAVYSNGFILEEGAFRPYTDPLSRLFIKNLVNGQFPDELREYHPNGVPIDLFDRHEDAFVDSSYPMWKGKGTVAVREEEGETDSVSSSSSEDSETEQEGLESHLSAQAPIPTWNPMSSVVPPSKERAASSTSRIATMTSTPRQTEQSFLSHLPKCTIKNGKIVDVRDGIAKLLHGNSSHEKVQVVDLNNPKSTQSQPSQSTSSTLTKLRIRYDDQNEYLVNLPSTSTVNDLRKRLLKDIPGLSLEPNDWHLKSPLGADKTYKDSMTLLECGFAPSAKLFILHSKKHVS